MKVFQGLLTALLRQEVEFIVIGGVAGAVHGAARGTFDLDIVYRRSTENLNRLVKALQPGRPRLRGADSGLPFVFDVRTLKAGLNFTLTTDLGDIDLLGEVTGGGDYEELMNHAERHEAFGYAFRVVTLAKLIELKRAAGRRKDLEAIAELELIRDRTPRQGRGAS